MPLMLGSNFLPTDMVSDLLITGTEKVAVSSFFDASATKTEYDTQFFGLDREDDLYAVTLGSAWSQFPSKGWVTTLNLNYSVKDSTVSLYEFDRLEVGVTLRKVLD